MLRVHFFFFFSNFTLKHARVIHQPADGSCLFHALNYGIKGSSDIALRRQAYTISLYQYFSTFSILVDVHTYTHEHAGKSRSSFGITQM